MLIWAVSTACSVVEAGWEGLVVLSQMVVRASNVNVATLLDTLEFRIHRWSDDA